MPPATLSKGFGETALVVRKLRKKQGSKTQSRVGEALKPLLTKGEIFVELIRTAFQKLNAACRTLEEMRIPPLEKIHMAMEGLLKNLKENEDSARYHLLIAQATVYEAIPAEAARIIARENKYPYQAMAHIMAQGQAEGTVAAGDPAELSLAFWTTIKGLAIHRAVHGALDPLTSTEVIMRMFTRA